MKTRLFMILSSMILLPMNQAFGCSRDLTYLFWSPIIDTVSADCSFVGYEPNPSGMILTSIIGVGLIGFVIWRKRK